MDLRQRVQDLGWDDPWGEQQFCEALRVGAWDDVHEQVMWASTPAFASTVGTEAASVSTANTNRDGTGTIATICSAGSSGTKIEEVVAKADGDPADSTLVWYLYDGTNYHVFDEWDIGNPAAGSTTVASYRESRPYENLMIPSGWSFRGSITVALTAGVIQAHCLGGDF